MDADCRSHRHQDRLEHDPEKHALAKARVDTGFRKRLVPANAGIMLHQ